MGLDDKAKVKVVEANAPPTEEEEPADAPEKGGKDEKKDAKQK